MKANAAAPELVLLKEEDYPAELAEFFELIYEWQPLVTPSTPSGVPDWTEADVAEFYRYLESIGAIRKQEGEQEGKVERRKSVRIERK